MIAEVINCRVIPPRVGSQFTGNLYELTVIDKSDKNSASAFIFSKEEVQRGSVIKIDCRIHTSKDGNTVKPFIIKNADKI